jgi:hypothetical protein
MNNTQFADANDPVKCLNTLYAVVKQVQLNYDQHELLRNCAVALGEFIEKSLNSNKLQDLKKG